MVKIPENFKGRVSLQVAREALTKSLVNKKNAQAPTPSNFKKMTTGSALSRKSYGSMSHQEYENLRRDLLKDKNLKIDKFDEQKIFGKESDRLDEIRKKKNIKYVHKEEGRSRGTLMLQRIRKIEEETMSNKGIDASTPGEQKTFYEQRIDRIKDPKGLRNETPQQDDGKPKLSQKPQLVEPPDMFG